MKQWLLISCALLLVGCLGTNKNPYKDNRSDHVFWWQISTVDSGTSASIQTQQPVTPAAPITSTLTPEFFENPSWQDIPLEEI